MAIPQRHRASPWPFLAMIGMAGFFFVFAARGLVAPWYGVVLLMAIWVVLFFLATRWWTPYPQRTVWLPLIALVVGLAVLYLGEALFDWTA